AYDTRAERFGAQRHGGADTAEPQDAECQRPEAADQWIVDGLPRRRRRSALLLVMQDDATAQRQGERHRVVGDLGGAVIGYVADHYVARRRGLPVDPVVADPHAHDGAQAGKSRNLLTWYRQM